MAAEKSDKDKKKDPMAHRQALTERFVEMLEKGEAPPWRKPWAVRAMDVPRNAVSGRPYRGGNALSLLMTGFEDNRWLTSAQLMKLQEEQLRGAGFSPVYDKNVKDDKGNITHRGKGWVDEKTGEVIPKAAYPTLKKGAGYAPVELWKFDKEQKSVGADGKEVVERVKLNRPLLQLSYVYNLSDVENLTLERFQTPKPREFSHESVAEVERVIAASGVPIEHKARDSAYYSPSEDKVVMPPPESFPTREQYYAVALHELAHSTSHESRLNRDISGYGADREVRAKEELRAELSSVFMAAELGVMPDLSNHGAYLASWAKALKDDPNELYRASADAQRIADFVLGKGREQEAGKEGASKSSGEVAALEQAPVREAKAGEKQKAADRGVGL